MPNASIRARHTFNAKNDAEVLRKAMKGLGANHYKVISILCRRTNKQRQEIVCAYKMLYQRDLSKDLCTELVGDIIGLIPALLEPPPVYDAKQLHRAIEAGHDATLVEILTTRTNKDILEVRSAYKHLYKKTLEKDIGEHAGCLRRLMCCFLFATRDESHNVNLEKAKKDAIQLYKNGIGHLDTKDSGFLRILSTENFRQLREVFHLFEKISKHSIEEAIEWEFKDETIREGLLNVISIIRNSTAYFAETIASTIKKLGVKDDDLMRLVVTRCEIDLADIREVYTHLFNASLENTVNRTCSSTYKDALVALIVGNDS